MSENTEENATETAAEESAEAAEAAAGEATEDAADTAPEASAEKTDAAPLAEEASAEASPDEPTAAPAAALPEYSYEELHGKTVAQLREIASTIEHDALHGYTTMHKEDLLPALCSALGIEAHAHHEVVGIDKAAVKETIRSLKKQRDAALTAADGAELKRLRRQIRGLKRQLRKARV